MTLLAGVNGLTKRWHLPEEAPPCDARGLGLVERLLAARGLGDPRTARAFCEPRLTDLHDPGLLPDIDRAAERLLVALRRDEPIAVYGDYDVDGMTATAILHHTTRALCPDARVHLYVPHRMDEGYGLNADAIVALRDAGCTLVVSVDCGITAREPAEMAKRIGVDLIVTDHHHVPEDPALRPEAYATVHPTLPGSAYPFPHLSGAGVAFKLAWRLCTMWCGSERVSRSLQETLLHMVSLAALGTIADVVPLVGENRVIASFGLRALATTPIEGLRALIRSAGLDHAEIDSEKVGFVLAPRLNACGRLGHAADAVELLTTASGARAAEIATQLTALNTSRQESERRIVEEATELARETGQIEPGHRAIILAHPDWHAGIVGIACARLAERFGRPTVLLQCADGMARGSARSVPGYSIIEGLAAAAAHLRTWGGHEAAAGLSLEQSQLDAFRDALVAHANAAIAPDDLRPSLRVDCTAWLPELDALVVERLAKLSPFGRGNPRPSLLVRGVRIVEAPRVLKDRHLKIRLAQENAGVRREIEVLWWNAVEHQGALPRGRVVDVVIDPRINRFGGRAAVEAEVKDIAIVEVLSAP